MSKIRIKNFGPVNEGYNSNDGRSRCGVMLASADHIYFVELKDEAKGWITDAIDQLESTIQFFNENHPIGSLPIFN